MNCCKWRIGLCCAFCFAMLPLVAGQAQNPKAADKSQTFKGIVVPIDKVLAKDIKLDPDAAGLMGRQMEGGKGYPLGKGTGARMFYKGTRGRDPPMRVS